LLTAKDMKKKIAILTLCAMFFALCGSAEAQQPKVYRIGMLVNGTSSTHKFIIDEFRQGLRELGYWEGKNVDIQYRYAEGKLERLPEGRILEVIRIGRKDAESK